jgi:hypothetical protein
MRANQRWGPIGSATHAIAHRLGSRIGIERPSRRRQGAPEMTAFSRDGLENFPRFERATVGHFDGADRRSPKWPLTVPGPCPREPAPIG